MIFKRVLPYPQQDIDKYIGKGAWYFFEILDQTNPSLHQTKLSKGKYYYYSRSSWAKKCSKLLNSRKRGLILKNNYILIFHLETCYYISCYYRGISRSRDIHPSFREILLKFSFGVKKNAAKINIFLDNIIYCVKHCATNETHDSPDTFVCII